MMETHKPIVSVVIPTFNSEKFIEETINSVLAQTLDNLEIIVVDDKSSDNTNVIIKKFKDKDERIKLYQIPHSGKPSVPRNFGVKKALGKYIAFLDSDDVWKKNKLEKQVYFLEKHPGHILVYSMSVTFDNVNLFSSSFEILPLLHKASITKNDLIKNGNSITCSSVLIKKEFLLKVGGFDEDPKLQVEDFDLWIRLCEIGEIGFIPRVQTYYRVHNKQFSSDWETKQYRVKYLAEKRGWNIPEYKFRRNKGFFFLFIRNTIHISNLLLVKLLSIFD
ncbi:MAG: hypothetical protein CO128_11060 [Ignavibacteriales bacterium CG_4_9_14_3_um_filter_30_11]|nr:MAG: hypothetical protein CO128_11060 [Ignavibacteriales bacterium CG_4_9_14_3_um_filter_30_11]